jgi:hypothetical protein
MFLAWPTLRSWRWRWYNPPKRRVLSELHGFANQKTIHFTFTAVRIIIIIIIIGKTALIEPQSSLEDSVRFDLVFTSLYFATIIILQSKVVNPASNPQPGGPGLCIYVPPVTGWPRYTPRHRFPFSSPSTTRRGRVEVFLPASIRGTNPIYS